MDAIDLTSTDPSENAERVAWLLANGYRVAKSSSQEADEILALVSTEGADDGENNGEQPRHPLSGQFISTDPETIAAVNQEVADAEKQFRKASDPVERERLGEQVSLARLRALYTGAANHTTTGRNTMNTVKGAIESPNMPALIGRLEKAVEDPNLSPVTKAQAIEAINLHRLRTHFLRKQAAETEIVGRAQQERADAVASIRDAQEQAATPGNTISNPRAQVQSITDGTAQALSLGAPAGANGGDFTGPLVTRHEDPIIVHEQLRDEFNESATPLEKQRLGDLLTKQRLVMARNGYKFVKGAASGSSNNNGDVIPVVTSEHDANDIQAVGGPAAPQYVNKQAKKASKARDQRIKKAVRAAIDSVV